MKIGKGAHLLPEKKNYFGFLRKLKMQNCMFQNDETDLK